MIMTRSPTAPASSASARRGQSWPVWLPIGGGHKHLQAGSASFPESGHPEPQRLCSPGAATRELTARRGRCLRGSPRGSPRGQPAPLLPLFPRRRRPVSSPRQARRARAGQRDARLPVLGDTQPPAPPVTVAATRRVPQSREDSRGGWGRRQYLSPPHALRRTRPAHVAKPPVRSEGSLPTPHLPPQLFSLRR